MDITNAMKDTSPIPRLEDASLDSTPTTSRRPSLSKMNTKSFAGVNRGALPQGLTDEVDVDLSKARLSWKE
jgi:predicted metal-dependent peptidase